ncbi:energy-coupling factor ABC transporter ATP-binding protein [Massilia sp. HP4]|uniref:energy-coupling factor ABC transporter ATP-binding protein n=1 Tax=Massilia sp. HP4 TaxID=2562316 RepID=UPI0035A6E399
MPPLLTVHGLRKAYGERLLFDIERLAIDRAGAYVLTGANGSGKSTLLRMLGGLERCDACTVEFEGRRLPLYPYPGELRRGIVYVHQHPIMFSTSVGHNIAYGLLARGVDRQLVRGLVDEAMAWAGVLHLRDNIPARLSGGEKQRVALARARVLQPRLLLLDEPTANLDGAAREQVIALIPTLVEQGASVVMACHDRDLINLPGVRRLKLREGQLEVR